MGRRKISIRKNAAESIAAVALYIESKGMVATAEKFTDDVYDFIVSLSDTIKSFAPCRDALRRTMGYKCVPFRKKYTIAFIETDEELLICEFISSKRIHW